MWELSVNLKGACVMVRSSAVVVARNRANILDVAARRVKQEGLDGVTIPDVMRDAGMTQGGFYTHFDSKSDLTEQAMRRAFEIQREHLRELSAQWPGDHGGASEALAEMYITRTDPRRIGAGCPISALVGDVARAPSDSAVRDVWVEEFRQNLDIMATLGADASDITPEARSQALARLATLVGAALLTRAASGDPLAEEIREAVRSTLSPRD